MEKIRIERATTHAQASPVRRLLAFGIDLFLLALPLPFLGSAFITDPPPGYEDIEPWRMAVFVTCGPFLALYFLIQIVLLVQGQSIGKRLLRLRVVRTDGTRAGPGRMLARWLLKFGPPIILLIATSNLRIEIFYLIAILALAVGIFVVVLGMAWWDKTLNTTVADERQV